MKYKESIFLPREKESEITLYCGDNLEVIRDKDLVKDNYVLITDPPFNIGYKYNEYKDKMPDNEYYEWLDEIFSLYKQKVIIHYPEQMYKLSFQMGLFPEKIVSWVYNSHQPRQHRTIAFFGVKPDFSKVLQPFKNQKDKRIQEKIKNGSVGAKQYDWWYIDQVKNVSKDKTEHPAQMPVEIMKRIIGMLPNDIIVIDPFMGSGTTGVACKELGYDFIGIELDEKYYNIAKKRIDETIIQYDMFDYLSSPSFRSNI